MPEVPKPHARSCKGATTGGVALAKPKASPKAKAKSAPKRSAGSKRSKAANGKRKRPGTD